MSLLSFNIAKCVHTSNKFAICDKCVDVCPVNTIKIEDSKISFVPSECVGCGGCGAVCPTAAYSLDDFTPINYIFDFLEKEKEVFTCKDEAFPCIASLSVEELLSVALISSKTITLDIGPCGDCPIAQKNLQIIEDRAEEVNFLLEAMLQKKVLKVEKLNFEFIKEDDTLSRRELLSKDGLKTVLSIKQQFENRVESSDSELKTHTISAKDIQKITQKSVPDRRSLLLMALKRMEIPSELHTIDVNDISFISQKNLDKDTCTNCQMCYRICPTGALSSDSRDSKINFNPLACIQCHSCHDVCEPDSLTLKSTFSFSALFEAKIETLAQFDIKRCDECGTFFAYKGGEMMCRRCEIEESEAKEIWGIE